MKILKKVAWWIDSRLGWVGSFGSVRSENIFILTLASSPILVFAGFMAGALGGGFGFMLSPLFPMGVTALSLIFDRLVSGQTWKKYAFSVKLGGHTFEQKTYSDERKEKLSLSTETLDRLAARLKEAQSTILAFPKEKRKSAETQEMLKLFEWLIPAYEDLRRTARFIEDNPEGADLDRLATAFQLSLSSFIDTVVALERKVKGLSSMSEVELQVAESTLASVVGSDIDLLENKPTGLKEASEEVVTLRRSFEELNASSLTMQQK